MTRTMLKLYKLHNGIAGLLLFAGIVCIPRYIWAVIGTLEQSFNYFYCLSVMHSTGSFMFPAIGYGLAIAIYNKRRTDKAIAETIPPGFDAGYRIRRGDKFFAIARDRSCIVIVDMTRDYKARKPMDFLQNYIIQQATVQSTLTLQFNDFEFSSLEFPVPTRETEAIAAKLNFAAWS